MTWFLRLARGALSLAALALAAETVAGSTARAEATPGGPAIWRFADEDNTVWIFGSIHYLKPGLPWRRPELDAALAEAEVVFFEIALTPRNAVELERLTIAAGLNPPGERLSDSLSEAGKARLDAVLAEIGVSRQWVDQLRPWLALLELDFAIASAEGARVEEGVDDVLERAAADAAKEIRSFETPAEIVGALSDIPLEVQFEILEASLAAYERYPNFGAELEAAWLSGDVERQAELLALSAEVTPPIFDERLLKNRNIAWVRQIDAFMAGSDDALIVVGALHMVGPDSLIHLLEARGYVIERY